MYICMYVCMYACMYVYVSMYVYVCVFMFGCIYVWGGEGGSVRGWVVARCAGVCEFNFANI